MWANYIKICAKYLKTRAISKSRQKSLKLAYQYGKSSKMKIYNLHNYYAYRTTYCTKTQRIHLLKTFEFTLHNPKFCELNAWHIHSQ